LLWEKRSKIEKVDLKRHARYILKNFRSSQKVSENSFYYPSPNPLPEGEGFRSRMESYLLSLWERTEVRDSAIFRHFLRINYGNSLSQKL
jgi:hypothetical protein